MNIYEKENKDNCENIFELTIFHNKLVTNVQDTFFQVAYFDIEETFNYFKKIIKLDYILYYIKNDFLFK